MFENLRMLPHAPGVQIQPIPEDSINVEMEEEEEEDKEKDKQGTSEERISIRASEKRITNPNELSDSEDESDRRRDVRSLKKTKKVRQENSADKQSAEKEELKIDNNDEPMESSKSGPGSKPDDATAAAGK